LDRAGKPLALPAPRQGRGVTYLERQGRPMTVLLHSTTALRDADLSKTVLSAIRFVVERERLRGQIEATATDAAALPTGFVTFLMTDIEGSTALLRRLGDRYAALLNDVRGVIREAVLRASGREIDARADEFFAVFERPSAALESAVALQRTLGARAWPDNLDVRVRAGIHSGRPTLTDAGYIGLAVHTAARLCSAAHGGQIVLSAVTRAAVGDAVPAGLRFRNLGRHRLPGLPDAEMLFQTVAAGLRLRFPPPRVGRGSRPRSRPQSRRGRPGDKKRPAGDQLELPHAPA
jgi:class 3 adenylate cyclase